MAIDLSVCGFHTCPTCKARFEHSLKPGEMCYQLIGPDRWKVCPECWLVSQTAPLFIGKETI